MTRLSLYDKRGDVPDRKLPMCRMCCQLFASDEDSGGESKDRRIAAFRPCGHVFHYSCIMERYQKMEDNCNCVTCYSRFDDLPVILYMEWSKSARPIPEDEKEQIRTVTAPDEQALMLREKLEMMKLKLEGLQQRKEEVIKLLNETNDRTAVAKAQCEGLDELCAMLSERIASTQSNTVKCQRQCEELEVRIRRDENKGVIGEFCEMLSSSQPEVKLLEFLSTRLHSSNDPDDLLACLGMLYEHYHKKVKEASKSVMQLRTTVHSLKKDLDDANQRLAVAQRAKQVKISVPARKPAVVDRKTVPMKPQATMNRSAMDDDDLGVTKRSKPNYNFLNF